MKTLLLLLFPALVAAAGPYVPTYDAETAWYLGELGVTNLLDAGITGRGVRVGVIDFGLGDIVTGTRTNVHCAAKGGRSGKAMHGPAVEGVIASDVYGIAPECELYVYDDGDGTIDDMIAGFAWCASNGCRVINYSGGVHRFSRGVAELSEEAAAAKLDELRAAVRAAMDAGCVVVAAGGNAPNETLTCPQDVEGVINVGGITRSRKSAGLNDNWSKDFCAFGRDVPLFFSRAGATGTESGSSFAAPMATGIIALLLQQEPSLTRDEIYGILESTSAKLAEGRSKIYGFGLLQAARVPADYRRQAEFDAGRAAFVRTTSAELLNEGLGWNAERGFYEAKMRPGESIRLEYRVLPENATDRSLYWYCGNMPTFSPIGLDQVLSIPEKTKPGEFLVYDARNDAREIVCRLRVDVVPPASAEPAPAEPAAWRNAQGAARGAYTVALLGDTHFDAAPESVYHSRYDKSNRHAKVHHEEFRRNGEMWAPGGRCRSLVAAGAKLAAADPATRFVLQLGDLVQGDCYDDDVHRRMLDDGLAAVRGPFPSGLPFLPVLGNHDYRGAASARGVTLRWFDELLSREIGAPVAFPLLSFRVDDDRWILCDFETVDLLALAREIESDRDARYVFLATHGPLTAPDAASWRWSLSGWPNKGGCGRGVQELFEAVSRRRAVVLSGHMHWTAFFRNENPLGGYTELTVNSVWKADDLANADPVNDSPAQYGLRRRDKVNSWDRKAYDAAIARYKAGLKEYFLGLGAGHYRLEISDDKVLAHFYPGAATEPARTFDLTPGKPLCGSGE